MLEKRQEKYTYFFLFKSIFELDYTAIGRRIARVQGGTDCGGVTREESSD
jgi:hypothetical protein